jgi:CHAT domain-containing protein
MVDVVELADIHDDAHTKAEAYREAREILDDVTASGQDRADAERTAMSTLEWLWDEIAEPVLARLPETSSLPRITWCPTGPLTVLPLHAAGYHDPAANPAGRTVLDHVVSSYVPTLNALVKARVTRTPSNDRALVIAMPVTPYGKLSPLPGTREEADLVGATFSGRHTVKIGAQATKAAVLDNLRTHAYVHFACHGGFSADDPSAGALYLHDGPLTVLDVAALNLENAEFAFLSACQTAVGGVDLLDEAIHISGALQLAGYRQVIATLWRIPDQPAAHIANRVYQLATTGDRLDLTRTAHALHQVTRELRDAYPTTPTVWSSYIHTGP